MCESKPNSVKRKKNEIFFWGKFFFFLRCLHERGVCVRVFTAALEIRHLRARYIKNAQEAKDRIIRSLS